MAGARVVGMKNVLVTLLDLVRPQTAAAVRRHAARLGGRVLVGAEHIEVRGEDGESLAEVRRDDDGRWVLASWDERAAQYTGSSPDGRATMGGSYRYTYARTLRALRGLGVPAYRSPAAALATV